MANAEPLRIWVPPAKKLIIPESKILLRKLPPKPAAPAIKRVRFPKKLVLSHNSPEDVEFSLDERSQRIFDQIKMEADNLEDDKMRDLWMDALQTYASSGNLDKVIQVCAWRRSVVDLDEFMFGAAYLAMVRNDIFHTVIQACHDLDTEQYTECVATGAIGSGKTTMANIRMARDIYKLSCMRHPQTTFGVDSKSFLAFTVQSVRLGTAKKAVFEQFGQYVRASPYFKTIYPYDYKITSEMIFREQRIRVMPVSSSTTGAISMNVIGGQIDEANFMQKITKSKSSEADEKGEFDQAKRMYDTITRRRKSRFNKRGKLPGCFFLVSSSRFPDDFTELRAAKSHMEGGDDDTIYVYRKNQWEVKPPGTFLEETFQVQVGNPSFKTKLLEKLPDGTFEPGKPGCVVIDVPMDFHKDFRDDPDGALRDFAGLTTLATKPFIVKRDAIHLCMEQGEEYGFTNPYAAEEYDFSLGIPKPDRTKLRTDIKMFRTAHIDLGLTHDACGIAIGHIAGSKLVQRRGEDGKTETEILPVVAYDVILRVTPPPNGEIEFAHIRKLLIDLRDKHGLPIQYVTFDGFQAVDSRQILRRNGFKTDYLSVEQIEPYRSFRDALYDERVLMPNNAFLARELSGLELMRNGNKEKVDHRPNASKDVSDAVCGVYAFLITRRAAWMNAVRVVGGKGNNMLHKRAKPDATQDLADIQAAEFGKIRPGTQRKIVIRKTTVRK